MIITDMAARILFIVCNVIFVILCGNLVLTDKKKTVFGILIVLAVAGNLLYWNFDNADQGSRIVIAVCYVLAAGGYYVEKFVRKR